MNSLRGMLFYIVLGISVIPLSLALLLMVPFTESAASMNRPQSRIKS